MKKSIRDEFRSQRPIAMVIDDNHNSRTMTARRLKRLGFDVSQFTAPSEFLANWSPGMADVIIADWELSEDSADSGDHVLQKIRQADWDVPFVLVSGKLSEDSARAKVLTRLLKLGGARFVQRGNDGIEKACREAEELVERRDLALVRVILSLRPAAIAGESVVTTSGKKPVRDLLAQVVARPSESHFAESPVADAMVELKVRPHKSQ